MARRGSLIVYARTHATLDMPLIPASWDAEQSASRWAPIWPLGRVSNPGVFFHARLMIRRASFTPNRGLFVCVGTPVVLAHLANRIASDGLPWTLTWASIAEFRADARPAVAALRAEYPDERPRVSDVPVGALLALHARVAGFDDDDGE